MFDISRNGIITLARGDSFTLDVTLDLGYGLDSCIYKLKRGDKVYFGLMEPNQPFEHALIRRVFDANNQDNNGVVTMKFPSTDTEFLMPGDYYYMIKLVRCVYEDSGEEPTEYVDTIVNKTKFVIID